MKITAEHAKFIRVAILANSKAPTWPTYQALGFSAKRWRWDLLYAAGISQWISDNVYTYADDEHIDTVLRSFLN